MELFPGVHLNKAQVAGQDKEKLPSINSKNETKPKLGRKKQKLSEPVHAEQD
jgi:hypothetical protein